ncbi:hypothetical protein PF008_g10382 [Phytophthora fragariae]|uniref:Uncharacterized protein n=1 Tax=Phytophthora fragariae TaxID=53985 RepID=A0A6G0RTY9_9STRA|nr:hypothetical protein PF008_g10382 [Phytophthora fragariae]
MATHTSPRTNTRASNAITSTAVTPPRTMVTTSRAKRAAKTPSRAKAATKVTPPRQRQAARRVAISPAPSRTRHGVAATTAALRQQVQASSGPDSNADSFSSDQGAVVDSGDGANGGDASVGDSSDDDEFESDGDDSSDGDV